MFDYNIEILSVYAARSENNLNDVVKRVTWKYQVKDGSHAADLYRDTTFDSVDPDKFINYDTLSPSTIIEWISEKEDMQALQAELMQKLDDAKNPQRVVEKQKPWDVEDLYDYKDKYVLFHEGKMLVGGIFWNSQTFNRYLKQVGLPESLPEDIVARQQKIVPVTSPLVINEETDTKIYKCVVLNEQPANSVFEDNDYIEWDLSVWPAEGTYTLVDRPLETVKERLRSVAEDRAASRLFDGVQLEVHGQVVKLSVDSFTKLRIIDKINEIGADDRVIWKFSDSKWVEVTKLDLENMLAAVKNQQQVLENQEYTIIQQINNATSVSELKLIEV